MYQIKITMTRIISLLRGREKKTGYVNAWNANQIECLARLERQSLLSYLILDTTVKNDSTLVCHSWSPNSSEYA